uniref:Uncharacterized protein n=1 Tax=Romanomermis culicivorax TaxID=13658 RepID=A0A915IU60_ROMCU
MGADKTDEANFERPPPSNVGRRRRTAKVGRRQQNRNKFSFYENNGRLFNRSPHFLAFGKRRPELKNKIYTTSLQQTAKKTYWHFTGQARSRKLSKTAGRIVKGVGSL